MSACFNCTLPDCDDRDRRCLLRKGASAVSRKCKAGQHDQITPDERKASNERYHVWEIDRLADLSERGQA